MEVFNTIGLAIIIIAIIGLAVLLVRYMITGNDNNGRDKGEKD